jgi:hypothetical protein
MFWGCVLKDNKAYKTQSALEDNDYPVLHISNVALPKNAPEGKVYLTATMGKQGSETVKDLVIATLQKNKVESVALDLYVNVSQQITLSASGPQNAELHLSGFFEPQREAEDDEGMFMDGEEIDEDESEEEEAGPSSKKLNQSLKQAQVNAKKNVLATADDDEDDEDDEDDYDDEDLEDDEEEEDESEEVKPVAKKPQQPAAPTKPVQQAQQKPAHPQQPVKKEQTPAAPAKQPTQPQKQAEQKKPVPAKSESDDEEDYDDESDEDVDDILADDSDEDDDDEEEMNLEDLIKKNQ